MQPERRAVIDIGTNSVKLLVADILDQRVRPIREQSKQTRLGSGFYQRRMLQSDAIAATASAVASFADEARADRAASIRIFATSAARDAANARELTEAIERACALKVEVISGEQEADWVFAGVAADGRFAGRRLLLLDVGGGSTEFILGHDTHKDFRASLPVGSVRLFEQLPHSDPPKTEELAACRQWLSRFLATEVRPLLESAGVCHPNPGASEAGRSGQSVLLVGTGGTATILARLESQMAEYDRERIEATRLTVERVRWHTQHLWSLPLAERQNLIGLPKNRADIILTGVAIYEAIMEHFGFPDLLISTRGLRFAAVIDMSENRK
jgi:exopolyphosphatase/guanosine-5'-triphosphate,3'-diphosphate pyrophosphatase